MQCGLQIILYPWGGSKKQFRGGGGGGGGGRGLSSGHCQRLSADPIRENVSHRTLYTVASLIPTSPHVYILLHDVDGPQLCSAALPGGS